MRNTSSLFARAGICVECHVGPKDEGHGQTYQVDHELIAAGHPRLSFEFSAYLANLPPHWDVEKDKRRSGSNAFHFDAWRFGQLQQARMLVSQLQHQARNSAGLNKANNKNQLIEFANYDCFGCHQQLRLSKVSPAGSFSLLEKRTITPRPIDFSLVQSQVVLRSSRNANLLALGESLTSVRLAMTNVWTEHDVPRSEKLFSQTLYQFENGTNEFQQHTLSPQSRRKILHDVATELDNDPSITWEAALQFYLAIAAFIADEVAPPAKLLDAQQELAAILNHSFGKSEPPSIFKSPSTFDGNQEAIRRLLKTIKRELSQIRQ